ncbi:tetraprenyl-beta-curcumene synthase family protein [Desulfosporosinus lacus]|uniref:Tetraprenyl-beta-curcumene synthase n=1 Tax=Desulfosporosinus lacus DSM 15449 TaxID=1121420 RepID=A0A1M5XFZ7_9FIRM|nr:tetraprenyl-beta-curcumene synthase family protein [Desulfosporosinus lacus]SHH98562.1 tetraprenyl-beta-curcumene synthase [Desulfosporosinus lacus DSM 15449]
MNTSDVKPSNRVKLIYLYVTKVFPIVKQELNEWKQKAKEAPDARLSQQALESIRLKAFHCQGGSIYALYPGINRAETIRFIVAYQTMSDYLDNLVDSLEVQDENAFSQLHLAMQEALNPEAVPSDYYLYYPYREDGGYLEQLVKTCQESIRQLPSHKTVQEEAIKLAELYSYLQTYKHLAMDKREAKMLEWINPHISKDSQITAWEFAAATGSTLGIFCLYAVAHHPKLPIGQVKMITNAYFPWICGLHILLDYFIDLREDRETNQLNFVAYYDHADMIYERMHLFLENSLKQAQLLEYPKFHEVVIKGLLAMYLSDEKSMDVDIQSIVKKLLDRSGVGVKLLYRLCRQLRKSNVI